MEVRLVAPSMAHDNHVARTESFTLPRLALQVLAALTPPPHHVTIIDENVAPDVGGPEPDLAGITVTTHMASRAYAIADGYRQRGIPVVLGGIHPTVMPREALEHADAVVVGEAELQWPRLLADAQRGLMRGEYRQDSAIDLRGSILPRRDLYPRPRRRLPFWQGVETSRGCAYSCEFCSTAALPARRYRTRPLPEVIRDLQALEGHTAFIVDDALAQNRAVARALFEAMVPLGLTWIGQATASLAEDQQLLALMRRAGCIGLLLGLESVNREAHGGLPKLAGLSFSCDEAVRRFHDQGISVMGSFVFGLDSDTPDVFDATLAFANRCRLDAANPCLLKPYPGTALHRRLAAEGRLEEGWWLRRFSEQHVAFRPLRMTADQLTDGWMRFGRQFYSAASMLRRLTGIAPLKRSPLSWAVVAGCYRREAKFFRQRFEHAAAAAQPGLVTEPSLAGSTVLSLPRPPQAVRLRPAAVPRSAVPSSPA